MAVALIVAAGRGERLGASVPKALVRVGGRPMLEWSVEALRSVSRVRQIVVALPAAHLHAAPAGTFAVAGGRTRSDSVLAALGAVQSSADEDPNAEPVIVHDAARIFAAAALFDSALDMLERSGADAVVAAAPVTDTIKQTAAAADGDMSAGDIGAAGARTTVRDLTVTATVDRSALWAVQTPQVFRRGALESALRSDPELLARATDDAWLIERAGGTVLVLPAAAENFKITTALDLRLAEMMLAGGV